jgi:hypothetical protein
MRMVVAVGANLGHNFLAEGECVHSSVPVKDQRTSDQVVAIQLSCGNSASLSRAEYNHEAHLVRVQIVASESVGERQVWTLTLTAEVSRGDGGMDVTCTMGEKRYSPEDAQAATTETEIGQQCDARHTA